MSTYATIYLSTEPTEREAEAFYSEPVKVIDDSKTGACHWEALITGASYDVAKLTGKAPVVFSTCPKTMLKPDGKPRHVFGAPGNVNDPETVEATEGEPNGKV